MNIFCHKCGQLSMQIEFFEILIRGIELFGYSKDPNPPMVECWDCYIILWKGEFSNGKTEL
jgi:hypothetical protein